MALADANFGRRLVRGARNSPWILIALGLHVILATVLSVVVIRHERRKTSASGTEIQVGAKRPEPVAEIVPEPKQPDRSKIPEIEQSVELVSIEEQVLAFVPTEEPEEVDWHEDLGDPTGTEDDDAHVGGTSIGVGIGGIRGDGTPGIFGGRPRPGKGTGGLPGGRPPPGAIMATEKAVLEGLRWLMRHQEEDGSWSAANLHTHCAGKTPCIAPDETLDRSFDAGMTALALLPFLGQGITVGSRVDLVDTAMGRPPRSGGDVVKQGIRWLLEHQKPDGSFSDSAPFELPENDTLATMALCEAAALTRGSTKIRRPAQRAIDFLVAAQKRADDGKPWGWGVGSQRELEQRLARGELDEEAFEAARRDVDLSITCWVVMALKSAQSCGFDVPQESLDGALAYGIAATAPGAGAEEERASADPQDAFTYHPARRAALGMLVRAFAGGDIDDPFLAEAARALSADAPRVTKDRRSVDFYYWYFATLALQQYDGPDSPRAARGEHWEPWNRALVEALLPLQDRLEKRDACARGGWLQEARGNRRGRALYNTALNVLTLEVYYRFENVFGAARR